MFCDQKKIFRTPPANLLLQCIHSTVKCVIAFLSNNKIIHIPGPTLQQCICYVDTNVRCVIAFLKHTKIIHIPGPRSSSMFPGLHYSNAFAM